MTPHMIYIIFQIVSTVHFSKLISKLIFIQN